MAQQPRFCSQCGAQLTEGARFCGGCGATTSAPAPAETPAPAPVQPPATQAAPVAQPPATAQPAASSGNCGIWIAIAALGAVVFLLLAALVVMWMMKGKRQPPPEPPPTGTGSTTTELPPGPDEPPAPTEAKVPGVVGMAAADAELHLRDNGGFTWQYNSPRYSDKYAEGVIISQHPPPGTMAKPGDTVYIVESRGAPPPPPKKAAPTPRASDARKIVANFLDACKRADSAAAKGYCARGADGFDLDLLGQGDAQTLSFSIQSQEELSSTEYSIVAVETMLDLVDEVEFYDTWEVRVKLINGRWQVTRFGTVTP